MRQTELLNMVDVVSFESYDKWLSDNAQMDTVTPREEYIIEICAENGYVPLVDDMSELMGELMFCIEQYSTLLYTYYTHAGVYTMDEANAVSIMATMQEDMNSDLIVF
jgi:hypothetical protein